MNTNRCHCPVWVLLVLGVTLTLSAQADLSSIFTNANANTHPAASRPRRSSLIVIQCDGLGFLDLSCYGQQRFATPNLDRLAAGGMLFTNYDANGADGPAVRAALLLGRDPGPTPAALAPEEGSVAQRLKADGYHTGLIGEWNWGGQGTGQAPWDRGFDDFAGYFDPADAENYYADFIWRYAPRSILNPDNHQWETYLGREGLSQNAGGKTGKYIPDLYTHAALEFIRINHPDFANHYRPFFLWLCYPTPRPNQAEFQRTGNGLQVPTDAPYSDEPWPQAEKNKAAMIARLDGDIGKILDQLKAQGMSNNAAVFFSSATVARQTAGLDPAFFPSVTATNDVRLPMIAWWPQHIPAGRVSGFHWSPRDFLPTAAAIAMLPGPTNVDGVSLLPVLSGRPPTNAPAGH
jgi:arylsulfatase A-like enzyme